MRILELNFEKTWRGGERQTLYNMIGFRNRGLEVELVCRKDTPLENIAKQHGFTVHAFDGIFKLSTFLATKAKHFDIMHAQTAQVLTYCAITKPLHHCKLVYTRRVNFVPKGKLTRWKYLQADGLVGISRSVQKIVSDFTGRKDVHLISSAIVPIEPDKERVTNFSRQPGLANKNIIATTAALTAEKGPYVALDAIAALGKMRHDFVFVHFGDGVLKPTLQQKIKEKGLEEIYLLQGHTDMVEDFYSVMDVFLMSSFNEGLGSSVLDAFFYRVPVVSSNAGGLQDLVSGGKAIPCEPGDANAMAQGIDFLLNNPSKADEQKELAYQYVMQHHSLVSITQAYITLFEQLLKQN